MTDGRPFLMKSALWSWGIALSVFKILGQKLSMQMFQLRSLKSVKMYCYSQGLLVVLFNRTLHSCTTKIRNVVYLVKISHKLKICVFFQETVKIWRQFQYRHMCSLFNPVVEISQQ
jgi:hypothetical protein